MSSVFRSTWPHIVPTHQMKSDEIFSQVFPTYCAQRLDSLADQRITGKQQHSSMILKKPFHTYDADQCAIEPRSIFVNQYNECDTEALKISPAGSFFSEPFFYNKHQSSRKLSTVNCMQNRWKSMHWYFYVYYFLLMTLLCALEIDG